MHRQDSLSGLAAVSYFVKHIPDPGEEAGIGSAPFYFGFYRSDFLFDVRMFSIAKRIGIGEVGVCIFEQSQYCVLVFYLVFIEQLLGLNHVTLGD